MPTELTVPVHAPGATQAAQQIQGAAVAADKLAAAEVKASAAADKLAASQQKVQTATQRAADAMKRSGQVVGGVGGGVLSRAGGAIGGQLGLAGGAAALAIAGAAMAVQALQASADRAERSLTQMANIAKAAAEAGKKVQEKRQDEALNSAVSNRASIARLLASGMSMQDIKAAGPGGLESLEKMSKRQRGQAISIATEAAKLSGGAMTVQDILEAGGGRDARSALAKALGVSVGGLDDALKRLEPASGFFDLVGKEEQRKQTGAGADMLAEQQIILAQGRARIAADPYASAVKARADAEREITETLKRRAAAEGAFLSMMKDIWPFGETSALKELRKTNQRITEAAPVDKASFSAGR